MTSLLFVYVVFVPILHILIIYYQVAAFLQQLLYRRLSHIIVSTHRQRYIVTEMGFKQDSPNPNLDSFNQISNKLLYTQHTHTYHG